MSFWGSRARAIAARVALTAALVGLFGGLFAAAPAAAAGETAVLQISKTVQDATLAPGDTLSYTIAVECLSDDCVDAEVTDVLPPEFDALTLNPNVIVTPPPGGSSSYSWADRTLTVNFSHAGGAGIAAGDGYSIQVNLAVPVGLSPDWEYNGDPVSNTASVSATTAATVTSSVEATVTVPYVVSTTASAAWAPPTTQFKIGEASALTLTTRNTSNARAETLTLLAPTDPAAASNLFDTVDFSSFGAVVFPAGADRVRVDAWNGTAWVDGAFAATAQLDDSIAPADVRGLRIVFGSSIAGAQLTANGSAGSVVLNLAQRATTRQAGTSLVTGAVVTATVRGTVSVPDHGTQLANASATYTIGGLTSAVTGVTTFSSNRIPAGTTTIVTTTGVNASNGPLDSLTVSQQAGAFLTEDILFDGFRTAGAAWPDGATEATVTWFTVGDPGDVNPAPVELTAGAGFPATPALTATQRITGFSVEFRGTIPAGATAAVPFRVAVSEDAVAASPGLETFTQTGRIDGVNAAGTATPATPSATLTVLYPQLEVGVTKTVTPSAAVPTGGRSVVQLRATTSSDSGYVRPTSIVITDLMGVDALDYWRGFDAVAIAPTQVPAGATLVIEGTTDGTTWVGIDEIIAGGSAVIHQAALVDGDDLVGLRFTFTRDDGFAQGTTMQANVAFTARGTVRGTTDPTSTEGVDVEYLNTATVDAVGDVVLDGGLPVSDSASATASGTIKTIPSGGSGGLMFDKTWVPVSGSATVSSQSGQSRTVRLAWGVEVSGYDEVALTDPADPSAAVGGTVFQTFDLVRIPAITSGMDPLLRYDQVTDVELYSDTTDSWVSVFSSACATASACRGAFPGYTLSTSQRADTLGVRITFEEYAAARTSDPLAPPVGSGVASGPDTRTLDLVFQLRNRVRDTAALADPSDPWVTGDRAFNDGANGSVNNTARMDADAASATDASSILVLDPVPGLTLTKAQQAKNTGGSNISSTVPIPVPGDVAAGSYPTVQYTMVATNTSAARAWYLRVTDQMPCTTATVSTCAHPTDGGVDGWTVNPYDGRAWDPATSPFQYLTIRDLNYTLSGSSGIDTAASTVTLWFADGTNSTVSLATAAGYNEAALVNVVGVSALFAGASADGGTIASGATATLTLETRLRATLRSSGAATAPATVVNSAFAQAWDGVLVDTAAYTSASQTLTLVDSSIAMSLSKSATVTSILEANRATNTSVTITANQGSSTASTRQVVVEDVDVDFWNTFELRSLTSVSMPSGANRVRVDVQLNGSSTWTEGTEVASSPSLPAGITNSQVTGLRVTYRKADNSLFSVTAPAAAWNTSIVFVARVRTAFLADGGSIPFPSTVVNDVGGTSTHPSLPVATASASRSFTLDPGTFRVDVEKRTPSKTTPAGETVDFSLIMTNTGTGYLDNPVVVDQLPVDVGLTAGGPLLFDPTSEVTYSTSTGGILPVTGVQWVYDPTGRSITFTWPDGSRLAPGEKYTIVIPLQVAPGLPASYGDVVNRMTFTSDRTLSACTNTSGNGEGVSTVGANGCRTSNDVTTISASAISSFKGVKGDVGAGTVSTTGALNVNNAAATCVADSQGFYRNPCAAGTRIGGTDLWKLQYTNGGNVPSLSATVVDVLPRSGDTYLASGTSRGSTYRPVFAGDVQLATDALSAGTTITWQVTTTANPCPSFGSNPTCTTATWVDGATFPTSSYASVRAIRVQYTFPGGELPPAATVAVTYRTVNTPTTSAGDGLAPVTVPLGTQRAWNSFGVSAQFPDGYTQRNVEPVRAGVQLAVGPLQVAKEITGVMAAFAPTSYSATAACTIAGANVVLPSAGALTLAAVNATPYTARLDGIPLGADCSVTETTTGMSSVAYSPAAPSGIPRAVVTIDTAAGSAAPVPVAHQATITNSYGTTDLTVTKAVSTSATLGEFGPFDFTLSCSVDNGTTTLPVTLAAGDAAFTLADAESHTVTGLPVTARCSLRESDSDGATSIGVRVGAGGTTTVAQNAPATITLGTDASYTATVTNTYASGFLSVTKDVTGATAYGDAEFEVAVECTYDGQTLFDDSFTLSDGDTETLTPRFPVGTVCDITETDAGGATVQAADRSVTIAAGTTNTVLTNRFDTGTLRVDKTVTGASARYGAGPFEAQVTCTWDRPGETDLVIPLPDSGLVELTSANGYSAEVTGLIAGADCTASETKAGAATHHSVSAPSPRYIPASGESVVEIENHFATGSLRIDKAFDIAAGAEEFAEGPFVVEIECGIDRDGTWMPLDLLGDETQTLSDANGYSATVDDILQGASCTVTETDAGLAIESETDPADGTVVIPASTSGAAVVTVTNTFLTGELDVEKTVDETLVEGGDLLHYSIAVENIGDVTAGGVTVTDDLDADLAIDAASITAAGWTCGVTGRDVDGYGGTLECVLDTDLGVGASAPGIAYTATLRPEVAQDTLLNTAVGASTTVVVAGDDDTVSTPVKWLEVTAFTECVQDAPWLDYTVEARNLDVSGRTMHVNWLAADGTVIHTDDIEIDVEGTVSGRLLFPGAAVDANGDGIAWPGWRPVGPGELPDWENLILDPTLPTHALRSGASVEFVINPTTNVAIAYPPATASCAEAPGDLASNLWMSKTASVRNLAPGDVFTYTMEIGNDGRGGVTGLILIDDVPDVLRIISVTPTAATTAGDPEWVDCVVDDRLPSGFGGTITCELDRDLGANQRTPDVLLEVQLSPTAPSGAVVNTARVTAFELPTLGLRGGGGGGGGGALTTLALQDSAVILTTLAATGASPLLAFQTALTLLMVGGILSTLRRRARHVLRGRRA
jgi:large repetitive protein